MQVTLIRLPLVAPRGSVNNEPTPSIGLAYIAGSLKEAGFDVQGIDATGEALERIRPVPGTRLQYNGIGIEEIIEHIRPDTRVVGVSVNFSHEWTVVRPAISAIKAAFPEAKVVVGGEHATAVAEYSLRDCSAIDAIVMGEGEETMVAYCQAVRDGGDVSSVESTCFLDNRDFVSNPHRSRIREVTDIPWPDWEALPIKP